MRGGWQDEAVHGPSEDDAGRIVESMSEAQMRLLREIHHSVRNNFQIVASLINLQKRMLPKDQRDDIRFLEEHVQALAAIYRVADVCDDMRVPVRRLVAEVIDNLRDVAGVPRQALSICLPEHDALIAQDQATALALYLAIILPSYLDLEKSPDAGVRIALTAGPTMTFTLSITDGQRQVDLDPLRQRLATSYLRQLNAIVEPDGTGVHLRFRLRA
jgi:hypothetical protein